MKPKNWIWSEEATHIVVLKSAYFVYQKGECPCFWCNKQKGKRNLLFGDFSAILYKKKNNQPSCLVIAAHNKKFEGDDESQSQVGTYALYVSIDYFWIWFYIQ